MYRSIYSTEVHNSALVELRIKYEKIKVLFIVNGFLIIASGSNGFLSFMNGRVAQLTLLCLGTLKCSCKEIFMFSRLTAEFFIGFSEAA